MNSGELFERARALMPGGVSSPVRAFGGVGGRPVYIERGSGAYIWDAEGFRYIDMIGSWGPMILGHAHPGVISAAKRALECGSSFGTCCPGEVELAQFVCNNVPSIEMVRFVSSGTEAAMSAIRLARAYTKRPMVVKFEGCYHGHSDALLSKSGSGLMTLGLPGSEGVTEGAVKDTITLPYNDIGALQTCFARFGHKIACVIIEPVAANMGVVLPRLDFLGALRSITREFEALLIFDEVITGFRLGISGAQGHYSLLPDLSVFGKIIGGGFPVGAYGGRADVMSLVAPLGPVYQAGTLSGNPVAMAAGYATLKELSLDPYIYRQLDAKADALARGMITTAQKHGITASLNRAGSLLTLFFTRGQVGDYESAAKADTGRYSRFFQFMLSRGVYFAPSQFEAAFISNSHSDADISDVLDSFDAFCLAEARGGNGSGK